MHPQGDDAVFVLAGMPAVSNDVVIAEIHVPIFGIVVNAVIGFVAVWQGDFFPLGIADAGGHPVGFAEPVRIVKGVVIGQTKLAFRLYLTGLDHLFQGIASHGCHFVLVGVSLI
jgi:hypothetical protein